MDKRDKISTEKIIKAIKDNYGIVSDAAAKLKITLLIIFSYPYYQPPHFVNISMVVHML